MTNRPEPLTEEEFLAELRAHIARKYHRQSEAAKAYAVSPQYLSCVVSGKYPPNQVILDDMGYTREKTAHYIKKGEEG